MPAGRSLGGVEERTSEAPCAVSAQVSAGFGSVTAQLCWPYSSSVLASVAGPCPTSTHNQRTPQQWGVTSNGQSSVRPRPIPKTVLSIFPSCFTKSQVWPTAKKDGIQRFVGLMLCRMDVPWFVYLTLIDVHLGCVQHFVTTKYSKKKKKVLDPVPSLTSFAMLHHFFASTILLRSGSYE